MTKLALQPEAIRVRHIVRGESADEGAVEVRDRWFRPLPREGLNGRLGFQSGQYELRLNEEGTFTLTMPNAAGSDGKLHRDRFDILQRGRATILPGGTLAFEPGLYRPGEEWLEVYTEGQAELLFVGTPTRALVSRTTVEIRGVSAVWLGNHSLETEAGFWVDAPLDVIGYYRNVWQAWLAEDFKDHQFIYSTTELTSSDGRWNYSRVQPGEESVRLADPDPAATSFIQTADTFQVTGGGPGRDPHWRVEVAVGDASMVANAGLDFRINVISYGVPGGEVVGGFSILQGVGGTARVEFEGGPGVSSIDPRGAEPYLKGNFNVVIEGRDRWVFFYINEQLIFVNEIGFTALDRYASVDISFKGGTTAGQFVDIDSVLVRRIVPLLGGGIEDLRLPGLPPPGGLQGSYFNDVDLVPAGATAYPFQVLAPTRSPYARRLDERIDFSVVTPPAWQPAGTPQGEYFSARWTGSVELDLETYDYRFRIVNLDGRARLWVGRTSYRSALIDRWTATGLITVTGPWLKADRGYPALKGWYPILIEFAQELAGAGLSLQYERSDAAGVWRVVNVVDTYQASVLGDSPVAFWRMSATSGTLEDDIVGTRDLTYAGAFTLNQASLLPGELTDKSVNFGVGATGKTASLPVATAANWSLETVFRCPLLPTTCEIVRNGDTNNTGFGIRIGGFSDASQLVLHYAGVAFVIVTPTEKLTPGRIYHVIATRDAAGLTVVYVNGERTYTGTPGCNTPAGVFSVHPTGSAVLVSEAAIWNRVLTPAEALGHYRAMQGAGDVRLSPHGIHEGHVRRDSHFEQLKQVSETFGYQWREEPCQLESPDFPGVLVPEIRVGRDTAYVLDSVEATDLQAEINAEEATDSIVADAAGLADDESAAQLGVEVVDFEAALEHLFVHQTFESLAEFTDDRGLQRRVESLLAILETPWEEVRARPRGFTELVDRFPLTDELAKFAWLPGDAVRLNQPELGMVDTAARQLLGVTWPFVPNGRGRPDVSFRQRTRGWRHTLRRMLREQRAQARNYQGQLVVVTGQMAQNTAAAGMDNASRCGLPTDLSDVVKAELVVVFKDLTTAADVSINGVQRFTITKPGRYDVTPWVARVNTNTDHRMYAVISSLGTVQYRLELLVRV